MALKPHFSEFKLGLHPANQSLYVIFTCSFLHVFMFYFTYVCKNCIPCQAWNVPELSSVSKLQPRLLQKKAQAKEAPPKFFQIIYPLAMILIYMIKTTLILSPHTKYITLWKIFAYDSRFRDYTRAALGTKL